MENRKYYLTNLTMNENDSINNQLLFDKKIGLIVIKKLCESA